MFAIHRHLWYFTKTNCQILPMLLNNILKAKPPKFCDYQYFWLYGSHDSLLQKLNIKEQTSNEMAVMSLINVTLLTLSECCVPLVHGRGTFPVSWVPSDPRYQDGSELVP